jgi:hypothetical protein
MTWTRLGEAGSLWLVNCTAIVAERSCGDPGKSARIVIAGLGNLVFGETGLPVQLGTKGIFVQADDWRLAGDIVDGQDVEARGAIAEAAVG